MQSFHEFIHRSEEEKDVAKTLRKLPDSHRSLIRGFRLKFHGGNTLNGDKEHVGYMDAGEKEIAVAAPYNYSREMTLLHEIGHLVWERISPELKREWESIVKRTKHKQNQNAEELFCMAYGAAYSKNPPTIHHHQSWLDFIDRLPK